MEADHNNHMAFPCRSFSSARRSDEHGEVPVVRTLECRDGWGMDISEEGNEILKRSISLAFRGMQRVDVCHGKSRRFVRMVGHFHSKAFEEWGGGASWTGSVPIWSWFGETHWYSYNSSLDERSAGALQTDKASWTYGWWPHRQDVGPSHWHHDGLVLCGSGYTQTWEDTTWQ